MLGHVISKRRTGRPRTKPRPLPDHAPPGRSALHGSVDPEIASPAKSTQRLEDEPDRLQSTYIPLGTPHRLNPGKIPLHVIEVQSGSYLGEDDIVRFEDHYGRE
jgi:hypothetical protein